MSIIKCGASRIHSRLLIFDNEPRFSGDVLRRSLEPVVS